MESKEKRIAELKKQILEIEKETTYNYALIKIVPDCGAGIKDDETILAVSEELELLLVHCELQYAYKPKIGREFRDDNLAPCDTWYRIEFTDIQIFK